MIYYRDYDDDIWQYKDDYSKGRIYCVTECYWDTWEDDDIDTFERDRDAYDMVEITESEAFLEIL